MNNFTGDSSRAAAVKVGDKAPDFVLATDRGEKWRLSQHLGDVTALLFYPQNETLVCTRQMCSIRDNWTDYLQTKAVVVGISPGNVEQHSLFSQNHRLPLPLLADNNREITKIYGSHWLIPIQLARAIVVIDAKGIVRHRKVMFRVFRPTDKSVLTSIYAARTDALQENFNKLLEKSRERNKFFDS